MTKKQIAGLVITAVVFVTLGTAGMLTNKFLNTDIIPKAGQKIFGGTKTPPAYPEGDYIAVVSVKGTIEEQQDSVLKLEQSYKHDTTLDFIDKLAEDGFNKGILLYLDTLGGSVYESDELYLKLKAYKEKTGRPVWAYMSHMAASGGYYVAMSSDRIYANRNAMTGSIGVIISGLDMTGLYEKLGMKYYSVTSGDFKDSSVMTDEQRVILQSLVDEAFGQFVSIVAEGRHMSEEEVRKLADGRVYSAAQALDNGLIDKISSYEEMKAKMSDAVGTDLFYAPDNSTPLLSLIFSNINKIVPKSDTQVLKELKDAAQDWRLMYYAGER